MSLGRAQMTISEGVEVQRTLSVDGDELVGVLEIRSNRADAAVVHLVDEFPLELPVRSAAFTTGARPMTGVITLDNAVLRQPVDEDPVRVGYRLSLTTAVDEVWFDPPTILGVEPVEFTTSGGSVSPSAAER